MLSMRKALTVALFIIAPPVVFALCSSAVAGDTLTRIKARGKIRCGVSEGIPGFSIPDANGRWTGMDVDFCRGLAAAVLADPEKVEFVPLTAAERFPSLKAGRIDVLVRNTSWTLQREAMLEAMFAGVLYHDGQYVLAPAGSNVHELSQLNGAAICVVKGTTHEGNLAEYFQVRGWSYRPVTVDNQQKAAEMLFAGQCGAFTSERPQLTAMSMKAPGGPGQYLVLPDQISREPMGPAVLRGDDEWFVIVRWVLFAFIRAEEIGVTQSNIRARLQAPGDVTVQRWRDLDGSISKALDVPPGWATRAVEGVGNYGEMFDRNLGSGSALQLERGLNHLWTRGASCIHRLSVDRRSRQTGVQCMSEEPGTRCSPPE